MSRGFSNVPWRKRAFGPGTKYWYQVRFFRSICGHSWGLVYGEGGAPGTVPLHNLRVTSHAKRCPSGGTEYVSFELFLGILSGPGEGRGRP